MKFMLILLVSVICLSLAADSALPSMGSNKSEENEKPKGFPYTEGTVLSLTFVRTKRGMTNEYIRNLAGLFRKEAEEMKKEGLIVSYKVYVGPAANKEDWDVMTMIEYKNMAALDGIEEKTDSIVTRILGTQEKVKDADVKRGEIRDILGEKIVREVIFK